MLSFHYKLDFPQRSSKFCVFQFFYVLISRYTNPKYNKDQPCKLRTCIFMIQIWKIGTSVLWRRRYHWLFIQWEISPPAACVPAHSSCSQTPPCLLQSTADRWSLLCSSHCSSHSWQTHSESVSRGTLTMWVDAHASWTSSVVVKCQHCQNCRLHHNICLLYKELQTPRDGNACLHCSSLQRDAGWKFKVTVIFLPEDQTSLNARLHFLCQMFNIGLWDEVVHVADVNT